MKQDSGEEYECVLTGELISYLLGCTLGIHDEFKIKHGMYMKLFRNKRHVGKLILSSTTKNVGYSNIKKENEV
jgi:hypothetical protein